MNKKRVCYMTILTEEQPPKSIVGYKFASTQTRDSFCCVRNVRDVVGGIRILVSRRKTNQHCLSVLNRGSRDEHAKQRVRSGAVPTVQVRQDVARLRHARVHLRRFMQLNPLIFRQARC